MFGTVARMRVKKGMEGQLEALSRKFESRHVDGWMSTNIYRLRMSPGSTGYRSSSVTKRATGRTPTTRSRTSGSAN